MNGCLLVTNINDLDALIDAAIVERHDVAAGKRKDHFDAGALECARGKLSTVNRHRGFLAS